MRKPKEYRATQPGDIVQVDTLDVRPLPGVVLKHFTARDVVCRWDDREDSLRPFHSRSLVASQYHLALISAAFNLDPALGAKVEEELQKFNADLAKPTGSAGNLLYCRAVGGNMKCRCRTEVSVGIIWSRPWSRPNPTTEW